MCKLHFGDRYHWWLATPVSCRRVAYLHASARASSLKTTRLPLSFAFSAPIFVTNLEIPVQLAHMAPRLCAFCRCLPSALFEADQDEQGLTGGPEIYLPPLHDLRRNATAGCGLCQIWTTKSSVSWIPPEYLRRVPIRLRRSVIAPHMSVTAFIGADDIFVVFFYRIPPIWRQPTVNDLRVGHGVCKGVEPSRATASLSNLHVGGSEDLEIRLLRTWLDVCRSQHPLCQKAFESNAGGPSRLIDLQSPDESGDFRLIDCNRLIVTSRSYVAPRFVCLSHCWGEPAMRPIMTRKATLSQHLERIPLNEMSQTFQEAIRVTRELGERYIWIDSLCIVQDDPQDWETEAARMPAIYGSATLTIAALGAEDGRSGFCMNAAPVTFVDVDVDSLRLRFFNNLPTHWHTMYGDDKYKHTGYGTKPLRTRAWTLQERYLSVRSVHYADGVMLWECSTTKGSSIVPWGHHDPPDDFVPWPLLHSSNEDSAPDGSMAIRVEWYEILEDYSSRFMTQEMDKLPALSGMAARFTAKFRGDAYHAGIFRQHLPAALLWRSMGLDTGFNKDAITHTVQRYSAFRPRRPMKYRAPSWSWAALDGAISYDSQRLDNSGGSRPISKLSARQNLLDVIEVQTCHSTSDPFGAVRSSSLRVRGRVATVYVQWNDGGDTYIRDGWTTLKNREGSVVGVVYPDIMNELQFVNEIVCLEAQDEPYWARIHLPASVFGKTFTSEEELEEMGLVIAIALLPVPGHDGMYRRRGLVRWLKDHLFRDKAKIELTIL